VPHLAELHVREFNGFIDSVREFDDIVRKVKHIDSILTLMARGREKPSPKTIAELKSQRTSAMTRLESLLQKI